jgi:FAD/FMN-containing dehydrogenase
MPITDAEHNDAIQEMIRSPSSSAAAGRVFELAARDPEGAHHARERVQPSPSLLTLDIVQQPFRRHNLVMPYTPKQIPQPDNVGELVATLRAAADAWLPLKAIGDGYGFANTGFTRGYLVPTVQKLTRILPVEATVLTDPERADSLCKFEAGATIDVITRNLWARGKAVFNQPGYERLTYVGTMSSGGHGSGMWCGPLSEHVRALHLVTFDAQRQVVQFQVEPQGGISDPIRFAAAHPDVELVQDDAMFHACTVGMGCLGVIYSATIEVRNAYNIRETRTKHRFTELAERLPQLLREQGPGKRLHSIEIWVNPYIVDGDVWAILGEREETDEAPHGERALVIEYGGPEFLYRLVAWWVEHHPEATPSLINAAITATQAANVVMTAPKGLNFGATNLAPVIAASCGVPVDNIVPLVGDLVRWFQRRATDTASYITSPLGLRFVQAARAHLSPAYDRDTCMIEVPVLLGTPRARETLDGYLDFLFTNYNGRPHWGQVNDMPGHRLEPLYPKLDAFLESFRVLNPKGFFDNAFTEQMGFRMR